MSYQKIIIMGKIPLMRKLYETGMSSTEVAKEVNMTTGSVCYQLKKHNILRSLKSAICIAKEKGRMGNANRGKKFSKKWRNKISKAKTGKGVGLSKKPNGYIEYTFGENKGRTVHVILMENKIGRKLNQNECVHHINHNRSDNRIKNLKLMNRSEHSRLHAIENINNLKRDNKGRFTL